MDISLTIMDQSVLPKSRIFQNNTSNVFKDIYAMASKSEKESNFQKKIGSSRFRKSKMSREEVKLRAAKQRQRKRKNKEELEITRDDPNFSVSMEINSLNQSISVMKKNIFDEEEVSMVSFERSDSYSKALKFPM